MRDRLESALKASTADYCEIRFETEASTTILHRGEEVEEMGATDFAGGIVRACTKGGWGSAVFDDPEGLEHHVAEACRCAEAVGRETTELAPVDAPPAAEAPATLKRDFRGVSLDEKLALTAAYNDIIRKGDPAVSSSIVGYRDAFRTVHFASTRSSYFREERPRVSLRLGAVARDGALVQQAMESIASATDYGEVTGREALAREVCDRAVALLKAPQAEGGPHTVVLNPELAGVFVHEAFGHLSEADFLYENPKMRELMHLGREMGGKDLTIYDDGSLPGLIGSVLRDDEGTPATRAPLVTEGVLAGHLHSLETAAKMDARPTGNARAFGRRNAPIVRMTNTCIAGGDMPVDEMFGGVDDGIYAVSAFGGQTMMEMFTFSAAYGYRIENGEKGDLVRDVVLTGNVFETLKAIDGFGDDFRMMERGGGCGKGGQFPLPVTFGAPHLRIRDVVVGGR